MRGDQIPWLRVELVLNRAGRVKSVSLQNICYSGFCGDVHGCSDSKRSQSKFAGSRYS